jgi:hypothetical protein
MDLIRSLLDKGAKVDATLAAAAPLVRLAQDTGDRTLADGATPFMRAARSAANKDGPNALMLAAGKGRADNIRGTEAQALETVKLRVGPPDWTSMAPPIRATPRRTVLPQGARTPS